MTFRSSVTSFAACAIAGMALVSSASAQCTGGGPGGTSPGAGAVNGTWPTTAATMNPLISSLAVTIPAGSVVLKSVTLYGYTHTWEGDAQIVLQDPSGALHNVYQSQDGVFAGGCGDAMIGDYGFVYPVTGASVPGCGPATTLPAGTYAQDPGLWPAVRRASTTSRSNRSRSPPAARALGRCTSTTGTSRSTTRT